MLCESCQKNEATFSTHLVKDGVTQSRNLCKHCHGAESLGGKEFEAAQRDARCEYCGGQPCVGGTDIFAMIMGVQKLKFLCVPCLMEHNRFIQEQLKQAAAGLSNQEQIALISTVNANADKHMKQWALNRGA